MPFRLFGRFTPTGGGGSAPGLTFRGRKSLRAPRQASDDNGESGGRTEGVDVAIEARFCVRALSRVLLDPASFAELSI